MKNFEVIPLFPNTIGLVKIEEDLSELQKIKKLKYIHNNENGSASTTNFDLLDNFPNHKKLITSYFEEFKDNVLGLKSTQFIMTTSWATKTMRGQSSDYHNHKNCAYSAVFYLDDVDEGGMLNFSNLGLTQQSMMFNTPSKPNIFNTDIFYIEAKKNMMVIFPSYLMHRINKYMGNEPRYSIAVNFIPCGQLGLKDSSVYVVVEKFKNGQKGEDI
jgi:uncharacterized protein (TIGR02466 family)